VSSEDILARTVFVAFTILATGGGFLVGRHFKGWKGGLVLAALVLAGLLALAAALRDLLANAPHPG
jgi:hypothetical protein